MHIRKSGWVICRLSLVCLTCISFLGLILAAIHGLPSVSAEGSNYLVNLNIDANISITVVPEDGLSILLVPSTLGVTSSKKATVAVATNNLTGYNMTFNAGDTGTDLINSANNETNTIPPTSGSVSSPAAFAPNTWGFAVPMSQTNSTGLFPNDTSGFASTYTEVESSDAYTETYAPVPASTSPLTLKSTSAQSNDDRTDIFFGAKMNLNKPSGTYRGTVVFTAIANYSTPESSGPCYNGEVDSPCQVDIDYGLIPIKYTGNTSTPQWSKADLTKPGDWYDYGIQKWANAVAVTSETLETYRSAAPGTVIPEEDVLGYYVYIPRYAYEVQRSSPTNYAVCGNGTFSSGTCASTGATAFNITFQKATDAKLMPYGVNGDRTGSCETYVGSYATCAGSNNKYYTHPAFTFGGTELNGIWVGKYETSKLSSSTTNNYNNVININTGDPDPIVKPNVFGRINLLKGAINTARNVKSYHSLSATYTDSRVMKNSEWGAVSYLSTSPYGRSNSSTGIEVWANNCHDGGEHPPASLSVTPRYVTGIGSSTLNQSPTVSGAPCYGRSTISEIPTANRYYGTYGVHASTTDNVYGIYDMNGGMWEYTLSNLVIDNVGTVGRSSLSAGSGGNYFAEAENKYFDFYFSPPFGANLNYSNFANCTLNTCGGHALFETTHSYTVGAAARGWNADNTYFATSGSPWFMRGYDYAGLSLGGVYANAGADGYAYPNVGYRLVLSRY